MRDRRLGRAHRRLLRVIRECIHEGPAEAVQTLRYERIVLRSVLRSYAAFASHRTWRMERRAFNTFGASARASARIIERGL